MKKCLWLVSELVQLVRESSLRICHSLTNVGEKIKMPTSWATTSEIPLGIWKDASWKPLCSKLKPVCFGSHLIKLLLQLGEGSFSEAAAIMELRMEGKKEKEEEEKVEGRDRATTNPKREEGKVEARGHRRARVGIVLTLISLRMTSIMLPITMRKSNTFQGSLKYPYTGRVKEEEEGGKRGWLAGKQHLPLLGRPIKVVWGWVQCRNTQLMTQHMKEFESNEHNLVASVAVSVHQE